MRLSGANSSGMCMCRFGTKKKRKKIIFIEVETDKNVYAVWIQAMFGGKPLKKKIYSDKFIISIILNIGHGCLCSILFNQNIESIILFLFRSFLHMCHLSDFRDLTLNNICRKIHYFLGQTKKIIEFNSRSENLMRKKERK